MAQQFNSQPGSAINKGFGYEHRVNFGKYKGKTYYDIANESNYNYLRWCMSNSFENAPDPLRFYVDDSCIPHIKAAISTENIKHTPWIDSYSEPQNDTGKMILTYKSYNEEKKEDIKGPEIEVKRCTVCKQILGYNLFCLGDFDKCKKCFYNTNPIPQQFKPDNIDYRFENRRGNSNYYRSQPRNIKRGSNYNFKPDYSNFHY